MKNDIFNGVMNYPAERRGMGPMEIKKNISIFEK